MNQKFWVNKGGRYWFSGVAGGLDNFAATKSGSHVVDCSFFTPCGGWSLEPVSIYYAGYRPESGFENRYFGLYPSPHAKGLVTIFDADRIEEIRFAGVLVEASGEFIFSRWRHDFRSAQTASISVDGGLDYFRAVGSLEGCRRAVFGVRDGQFVEIT